MPKRKHAQPKKEEEPKKEEVDVVEDAPTSSGDDSFPSEEEIDEPTSDDDEDGEAFDHIDVNFESFDPVEEDFHGLKTLLTNYLDGKQYSSSELVEAIIANPAGSVIKCGEDEEAIGVATVLSLYQHSSLDSLSELKEFMSDKCPSKFSAGFSAAWSSAGAAVLISERLLNCPPQLAPPLMESLFAETEEMEKNGAKEISQYIFMTRAYADPTTAGAAAAAGPSTSKKGAKKAKKGDGGGGGATPLRVEDLIFATPEGEFLANKASLSFSFPVPNRAVGKDDLTPHRVVMVVAAKEVAGAMREMREVVG